VKDETYAFISDVKDKGITARSARHTRTHCGKGGRVRLPSDNLSKKELQKMNGEVKSYRLNDPMDWKEFKSMPDDLKITYINLLRKKFNVPFQHIGKMLGVAQNTISKEIIRLGLSDGKAPKGKPKKWDKDGFYAWWHGVDKLPTPVPEEPTQEEKEAIFFGEEKGYVEDDLPFEEPDPIPADDFMKFKALPVPEYATPINGSMNFKCPANQALNTLAQLLGEANVSISVMWRVIEEGGDNDDMSCL
jgi:hypothetical protein